MYKVLVCDDDKAIVRSIEIYLDSQGYKTVSAYNGKEALEILRKDNDIHCIIMDIMMPVMDGITATLEIRKESNIPIIFLSAKSEDTDKIAGLGFGGDDYVTKPFSPLELCARVKSQIRRFVTLGARVEEKDVITTGGLSLDLKRKSVTLDGEEVRLTATEYGILEYLMKNPNVALKRSEILHAVWGESYTGEEKAVDVNVRRLRVKIEDDSSDPQYLATAWGYGYKWVPGK